MKNEILNRIQILVRQFLSILSGGAAEIEPESVNGSEQQPYRDDAAEIGHNTFHFYDTKKIVL